MSSTVLPAPVASLWPQLRRPWRLLRVLVHIAHGLALAVYYRDFLYALPIGIQLLLFASPVAYPVGQLDARWHHLYAFLNPTVGPLDGMRRAYGDGLWPDWSLLGEIEHGHPAYRQLLGYDPGTPADQMNSEKMAHVSPITHATKDDPPVLLIHGDADKIVPLKHAEVLDTKLDAKGGNAELLTVEGAGHGVAGT